MKLLTLNTHSRPESCQSSVSILAEWILSHTPDVIALQEVNQSADAEETDSAALQKTGFLPIAQSEVAIKQDNYALALSEALLAGGRAYRWCYLPIKRGYDRYDEGLALFFRGEAAKIVTVPLSATQAYTDWRRRMALGVRLGACWFYSLHTSRYDDPKEPFLPQWQRLRAHLQGIERVFLMGDFNCPADRSGEGYDRMIADGFRDTFTAAQLTQGYRTTDGSIDGWRDTTTAYPQRMDFILTNHPCLGVFRCETVFDGQRGEIISDHYGVFCHVGEEDGSDDGRNA